LDKISRKKKFPSPQIAIDSGSDKYLLFSRLCKHHFTCLGDHDHMCFVAIDIERKNKLIKVCYVPTTSTTCLALFVAVAINSIHESNKAGSMCH